MIKSEWSGYGIYNVFKEIESAFNRNHNGYTHIHTLKNMCMTHNLISIWSISISWSNGCEKNASFIYFCLRFLAIRAFSAQIYFFLHPICVHFGPTLTNTHTHSIKRFDALADLIWVYFNLHFIFDPLLYTTSTFGQRSTLHQ